MDHAQLIAKMRGRVDMCRRLATSTTDPRAALILRRMADEGEEDLRKLEAEKIVITITPDKTLG